ncbi:hypothetical protein BpHYR1_032825 [Brachionus plicatilis]|uniref:RNA-directed DNA polymerase from mobile element jockey-like n=1 Tax=Brachionus plicatilis TaxID=10195 RepID=A0A3M7QN54_BRAPC|nr:hypothetical protein BpHYR1_032825 [Brachionus plicatilis]
MIKIRISIFFVQVLKIFANSIASNQYTIYINRKLYHRSTRKVLASSGSRIGGIIFKVFESTLKKKTIIQTYMTPIGIDKRKVPTTGLILLRFKPNVLSNLNPECT